MNRPQVAVIGGGMSGLCAGLAAAEAGAQVVVLEAGQHPGGSMALSGGLVWTCRDLATIRTHIPAGDPELQRLLVDGLRPGCTWLEERGLPLEPEAACMPGDIGRGRLMGLGSPGLRGAFADALVAQVITRGGEVRTGQVVQRVRRSGPGLEIDVLAPVGTETLFADAVVWASGGFQNDLELLRRHVTPYPEGLLRRSNPVSAGVALKAAGELGLALSDGLSSFYGHSLPVTPEPLDPQDYLPGSQYYSNHCVLVNDHGQRFTDETLGLVDECNAQAGARQPGGRYFLVFDERIRREQVSAGEGLPGVVSSMVPDRLQLVAELGGTVHSAATLDELADLLRADCGMPRDVFVDTLMSFNDDAKHGSTPGGRTPINESPFYAIACRAGITYTMGGLSVDEAMRVRRVDGSASPNIFAAGADAGHVFENVYGGGLAWALVTGRLAGRGAAGCLAA